MDHYKCFCAACEGELMYNVKTIRRHYKLFNSSENQSVRNYYYTYTNILYCQNDEEINKKSE